MSEGYRRQRPRGMRKGAAIVGALIGWTLAFAAVVAWSEWLLFGGPRW